jgi:hypothetical protein
VLQNIKHHKKCPVCAKDYGNAKKGECGNVNQATGEKCTYVFEVNPERAKTGAGCGSDQQVSG